MKPKLITNWSTWVLICEANDYNPYEIIEFGIDRGGGCSEDFEYIGDVPKKEGE